MPTRHPSTVNKGPLSLSIDQGPLDRLEPHKQQGDFADQAEHQLSRLLDQLEGRTWAERNAEALEVHGKNIAKTGLAGIEFDRI